MQIRNKSLLHHMKQITLLNTILFTLLNNTKDLKAKFSKRKQKFQSCPYDCVDKHDNSDG